MYDYNYDSYTSNDMLLLLEFRMQKEVSRVSRVIYVERLRNPIKNPKLKTLSVNKIMSKCELLPLLTVTSKKAINEIMTKQNFVRFAYTVKRAGKKGDNFMGDILRVEVSGVKKSNDEDSFSVILKTVPKSSDLRKVLPVSMFTEVEIFAYKRTLPILYAVQERHKLPLINRFHHAVMYSGISNDTDDFLLLEDLRVKGYKMHDRLQVFDYDHLSLCTKNLARFHATSFVLQVENPVLFKELSTQTCKKLDFGDNFDSYMEKNGKKVLSILEDETCIQRVSDFFKIMKDELARFVEQDSVANYNVICHGDCWSSNFMFSYEDQKVKDVIVLDWQTIRCCSPVIDLIYMLFMSTDEDSRAKHFEQILDLYYETLSYNLSMMGFDITELYPEYVYRDHLKNKLAYGFIMAIGILPLTLSNVEDPSSFEKVLDADVEIKNDDEMDFSQICVERLRGIVEFCIENNYF